MKQNYKFLSIYPLSAILTPFPLITFTTEEITGCANEATKGPNKGPRKPPSFFCYFIFYCFSNSINQIHLNLLMILIISFFSPFKINKINLFPALTASFPLFFLSNLFIAFEVKLLTNPAKFCLAKGKAMFFSAFFLN